MFNSAINLMKEIKSFGFDAYIVGGCVRDILMDGSGKITDIDIVTNIPLDILKIYETADISKNKKDFDVIIVEYEGHKFEVASFRGENIYEDLKNRDFTINALAMNVNGEIIGHDISKKDIENKILRIGLKGEELFKEDALRVLRGCRMAVKYNLDIEEETYNLMKKYAKKVQYMIHPYRVYEEFMKGLALEEWGKYANLCYEIGFSFITNEYNIVIEKEPWDVRTRFLYVMRHCDEKFLKEHFKLPNDMKTLLRFYRRCWEVSYYNPWNDYALYTYLCENRDYYELTWPVYQEISDYEVVLKCDEVLKRGDRKKTMFVSGKDIQSILGFANSPKVGFLIREANSLIMNTDFVLNKKELLYKLNLM
mgnify:CR=1 FL=1